MHAAALERPVCALYVPAAQGSHAVDESPSASDVPAAHGEHAVAPTQSTVHASVKLPLQEEQ